MFALFKKKNPTPSRHSIQNYLVAGIVRNMDYLGVTEKVFTQEKQALSKQWIAKYHKEASDIDTLWKILNTKELEFVRQRDWFKLKMIRLNQAILCVQLGKDPSFPLRKKYQAEIREASANGRYKRVKVNASNSCNDCKKLDGTVYTVDQALSMMPLPNKDCTTKTDLWDKKPGYCRCFYETVVE